MVNDTPYQEEKMNIKEIKELGFEGLIHKMLDNPQLLETLPDNILFLDKSSNWTKYFTPKRMELLKIINEKNPRSVSELAKLTNRKVENVYRDLKVLEKKDLIKLKKHKGKTEPIVTKSAVVIGLS